MNYFGRAYRVTVDTAAGDHITLTSSEWGTEALRVTFDVEQAALSDQFWMADLAIYNLSVSAGQAIGAQDPYRQQGLFNVITFNSTITKYDLVTISAGYQGD